MAINRDFTILCRTWLTLILGALISISTAAMASDAPSNQPLRAATLQELSGTSQHTYDNETPRLQRDADRTIRHHSHTVWLQDISIHLNRDYDNDGYYSDFSITFDVDTHLPPTLVYAVLYLSTGGPLIEYAVSSNFVIGGAGIDDAYTIYATLDSGYQTGYYDHYIEIYDASTHAYLAVFGPNDSHVLHGLPFESKPHDHYGGGISTSVSFRFTGTGALDPLSFGVLTLCVYIAVRNRRRMAKCLTSNE